MAVPTKQSAPKTVFVSVSTGPSTSTKNTACSLVCSAFLSPLIIFSVFAEVYLIFYDIDRAISKKWMFLLLLVTLTLNITLNSTFEKPYKPLRFNALLSGIFTLCVWIWIVALCKKLSYLNSIVYFSMFVALHVIRLFAQSLSIAKSKNDQFVKEYLTDAFSSFGNWIYFFCLYFLPAMEFFIRAIYYPNFFVLMVESYKPIFYISWTASIILCFSYARLFAIQSRSENIKSFRFLHTYEILSLLELLWIIFGQISLFNPICLVLLVVIWVLNKTIGTARFLIKLKILPIVNPNPVSSV